MIASTLKLVRAGSTTSTGGSTGGSLGTAAALDVSLETKADVDVGALAHRLLLVTNPAAGIDAGLTKSHREGTKWSACS